MRIIVQDIPWDHPTGSALRLAQEQETLERYGGDTEAGPKPSSEDAAAFLLATDGATGAAVGCGGLRRLDASTYEIKRMYVAPEWRGRRIGGLLVRALEEHARGLGALCMRLETGAEQPEAMRLYERCGYTRIDRFGPYADCELSVCYERVLDGAPSPV
ncbi:GNAT family N-acetyltransferase [Nocardiopsis suaedae]|uniref:GNAT family N-acetyltransferase n=1 Tax=Nocardiopsis suaedae TaxID=3018444 RepID=A0ABT4TIP7_9ACTN|nr:GNAT family N-acetyltransferase [Nocardiopsis suaedae]MDA2804139.1 GNAT family N-acetyltransferase [Nocardiopsis suaedae]